MPHPTLLSNPAPFSLHVDVNYLVEATWFSETHRALKISLQD